MNKKKTVLIVLIIIIFMVVFLNSLSYKKEQEILDKKQIEVTVIAKEENNIIIQDINNYIYRLDEKDLNVEVGSNITLEYTGVLDKKQDFQDINIINYTVNSINEVVDIPLEWLDNGLFSNYYKKANDKLKELTIEEKIGQLLLVRYPQNNAKRELEKYKFGGYLFFERDFRNKTKEEVTNMINELQEASDIPLLIAVDEEGGQVVRVSSNSNLAPSRFKSSQELYTLGGFDKIKEDTIEKSKVLKELGINLNLAPVVDVSTNEEDYMYQRSFGKNSELTSLYAKTVIEASLDSGVSYTLKHFPGYGNNIDTHIDSAVDTRSYEDLLTNDLPPFERGIEVGAEAILVSHNIVTSIDADNPASLSSNINKLLRNELNFTGVIITDEISMGAVSSIEDVTIKAVLAGNDIIITTDYEESFNSIKRGIDDGTINEELINKMAFRILAWKYYKGLML